MCFVIVDHLKDVEVATVAINAGYTDMVNVQPGLSLYISLLR